MENKDIINALNPLIETSRDGDKGFTTCADDSTDASLKAYFTICATRCRESVRMLDEVVTRFGGTPEASGSVLASAHRAWLNLHTALTSKNDLAVLEECERAEDVAMKVYSDALAKDLPVDVRALVQQQFEGLKDNHDRVRKMRDEKRLVAAE